MKAYDEYADAVFRYCYFKTSDREKALDLAQETFIKVWEYMASGKPVEHMKAFIYRIASNAIIDSHRKKKSSSLEKKMEGGFDVKNENDLREEKEIASAGAEVMEILENLEEKYREILMLRYVDDLSIKEISKIVGESENNVSVRIHRGLEKLKKILKTNG
jgi:RNA polymerase sigma-70 factor (ECF subfamily)